MKKRLLFYEVSKQLPHKNALIITGMRQVGKTTLMKQIFEEIGNVPKFWFDFDNPLDQKIFEDIDYHAIYERLCRLAGVKAGIKKERLCICIDEIQVFPEITKIIKFLIDHYQVKFILTGSSNFYLKNLFPESLSGRKFLYELPPLNFREFLYFHEKLSLPQAQIHNVREIVDAQDLIVMKKWEGEYETFLEFGGFPEVVTTDDVDTKTQILKNIFASFFEKDLKFLSDYKDIKELRDLILLLVPRVGSMLDVSRLSSELGIARQKVYAYLEFLQGTFFIRLLPKYSKSIDRSVAGGRKVYFTDTGILKVIGNVNDAQLFENAVVNQMAHYGKMSFFHKRNMNEIDIILDGTMAFEVKLNATERDFSKLKHLSESIDIKQFFLISKKWKQAENVISPVVL